MPNLVNILILEANLGELQKLSKALADPLISLSTIAYSDLQNWLRKVESFQSALFLIPEKPDVFDQPDVIDLIRKSIPDIAIYALLNREDVALTVSCMKKGASNVISRSNIAQLKDILGKQIQALQDPELSDRNIQDQAFHAQCIEKHQANGKVSIAYINQEFLNLLQENPHVKAQPQNLAQLVHPEDRESYNDFRYQYPEPGELVSHKMRLNLNTSSPLWVTETLRQFGSKNGSVHLVNVLENEKLSHTEATSLKDTNKKKHQTASYKYLADQHFKELSHTNVLLKQSVEENNRKQKALTLNDEKLQLMFDQSPISAVIIDEELEILSANTVFNSLICGNQKNAGLTNCKSFIHPDAYQEFLKVLKSLTENKKRVTFETRLINKKSETLTMQASIGMIKKGKTGTAFFVVQFLDISERRALIDSIQDQNQRLTVLSSISGLLLERDDFLNVIEFIIEKLGKVLCSDRAYFMVRTINKRRSDFYLRLMVDYTVPGVKSYTEMMSEKPENIASHVKMFQEAFGDMISELTAGQHLEMIPRQLSGAQQFVYDMYGVKSTLIFPIMIKNDFYGLVGFDDCHSERHWDKQDISLIQTAAATIGHAYGRYLALEDVEKNRLQYETLAKSFPNGAIYMVDREHRIVLFHSKDYKHQFAGLDQLEGKKIEDLISEKDARFYNQLFSDTFKGQEKQVEFTYKGTHWLIQTVPNISQNQEIDTITVIAQNTTEQVIARKELIRSKEDYVGIFENAHDAILIFDEDYKTILNANQQAGAMYGYSIMELKALPPASLCKFPARGTFQIQETLKKGTLTRYENTHLKKDGQELIVEINSSVLSYGGKKAILNICHDITQRSSIEMALRETHRKYQQIIENTAEGIWILDNQAKTLYVNSQLAQMLGFPKEEMIETSLFDYLDAEDKDIGKRLFIKNDQGKFKRSDLKLIRSDGYFLWAILSPTPYYDETEKVSGIQILVTDISTRKVLEENLRESEERYKTLAENIPYAAAMIIDRDMRCLLAAGDAFKKVGKDNRPNTEGKTLANVNPKEKALFFEKQFLAAFNGEPQDFETTYHNRQWQVHVAPNYTIDNEIHTISVICHDITTIKENTKSLEVYKHQLETIFNHIPTGLLILDKKLNILEANPCLCNMLGYSLNELIEKCLKDITDPEDMKTEWTLYKNLFEGNETNYQITKRLLSKDNQPIWVNAQMLLIVDADLDDRHCLLIITLTDHYNLSEKTSFTE
jgi:PAS domain S-box-containing protein